MKALFCMFITSQQHRKMVKQVDDCKIETNKRCCFAVKLRLDARQRLFCIHMKIYDHAKMKGFEGLHKKLLKFFPCKRNGEGVVGRIFFIMHQAIFSNFTAILKNI